MPCSLVVTAAAHHAGHRVSLDDDHVVADLRERFDDVLAALEETSGWVTARVQRPVLILGRLDGARDRGSEPDPPDAARSRSGPRPGIASCGCRRFPRSRASRRGCVCSATPPATIWTSPPWQTGSATVGPRPWSRRWIATTPISSARPDGASLRRWARQLAEPRPDDLGEVDLISYRRLDRRWHDWQTVVDVCRRVAVRVLDQLVEEDE